MTGEDGLWSQSGEHAYPGWLESTNRDVLYRAVRPDRPLFRCPSNHPTIAAMASVA